MTVYTFDELDFYIDEDGVSDFVDDNGETVILADLDSPVAVVSFAEVQFAAVTRALISFAEFELSDVASTRAVISWAELELAESGTTRAIVSWAEAEFATVVIAPEPPRPSDGGGVGGGRYTGPAFPHKPRRPDHPRYDRVRIHDPKELERSRQETEYKPQPVADKPLEIEPLAAIALQANIEGLKAARDVEIAAALELQQQDDDAALLLLLSQ
jgi:hypothetical protein